MRSFLKVRFRRRKPSGVARLPETDEGKKREFIWWPDQTALDRQRIEIDIAFKRKGGWILVWRDEKTGAIKSKACSPPRKEK